jgi:small subunit ribosomal protein S9
MAEKKTAKAGAKVHRTYYIGTGRRKTAVARVRITEGKGQVVINGKPLEEYFHEDKDRAAVLGPLKVTDQLARLDVFVSAKGGGVTGQAGAVSQGLARAIKTMFSPADEQATAFQRDQVTVIKTLRDEKKEREKAKAIPAKPAAPTPAATEPTTPLIPGGTPAAPAAPADTTAGMVKKLRDSGYLTRDARMKERKKYGLRGARRGTQFSKR